MPAEHCPDAQKLPQVPQLFGSVCRVVQVEPHRTSPTGQVATHTPETQAWPVAQALPQPPQFAVSIDGLMQAPLQAVKPVGHWHVPLTHSMPAGH
jgi:hypothetical protein